MADSTEIRGEFVIIVAGNANPEIEHDDPLEGMSVNQQVDFHIKNGLSVNEAIKRVAKDHNLKKSK